MTRHGIIAVCLSALVAVPLAIWLHIALSKAAERNGPLGWLAMVSFLAAWLAVITFITTLAMLVAVP